MRPTIYLRCGSGGRSAVTQQEADVRAALTDVGIDHRAMHVSCDIDVPGSLVGPALAALMEEASFGSVPTLIVRDVARLGRLHGILVRVLTVLEGAGVEIVTTETLRLAPATCNRLRCEVSADELGLRL
jgi:DNA invertase Pin-like site-specific DNA recombinase